MPNGHRWVVSLDEPWTSQTTMTEFRVWDVWGSYMAGAGGCEFFQTGDGSFDDFRSKEAFYVTAGPGATVHRGQRPLRQPWNRRTAWSVRSDRIRAWRRWARSYLVYLPAGGAVNLDLTGVGGDFDVRWFDPRNGGALQDRQRGQHHRRLRPVVGQSAEQSRVGLGRAWSTVARTARTRLPRRSMPTATADMTASPVREAAMGRFPRATPPHATDCNDASATVYTGAPEVNDGIDNQCNGSAGFGATDEMSGDQRFRDGGRQDAVLVDSCKAALTSYRRRAIDDAQLLVRLLAVRHRQRVHSPTRRRRRRPGAVLLLPGAGRRRRCRGSWGQRSDGSLRRAADA